MYDTGGILLLFLEHPLHAGSGDSSATVDLPIQRERHTGYPIVQASGLKGSLRDALGRPGCLSKEDENWLFGPLDAGDAGALALLDARTLLFPVKSAVGVFGWISSPHVLERFGADLRAGLASPTLAASASASPFLVHLNRLTRLGLKEINGAEESLWLSGSPLALAGQVYLEERVFGRLTDPAARTRGINLPEVTAALQSVCQIIASRALPEGYWQEQLMGRTVIVPDDAFGDFVRYSTEIETHVKLGDNGTVSESGPWDAETLPAETILYTVIGFQNANRRDEKSRVSRKSSAEAFGRFRDGLNKPDRLTHLQVGGDATLGRGIARIQFYPIADILAPSATVGQRPGGTPQTSSGRPGR